MTHRPARTWVLVPAKPAGQGKTRLAGALGADERERLVAAMLAHVLDTALRCEAVERVLLLGPNRPGLDPRIERLDEAAGGLNAALDATLRHLSRRPDAPDRLIVVHGDLPGLDIGDLALMAAVPGHTMGLAPDRHGTGTNALSLPLPQAAGTAFRFGIDSAARHRKEAENQGLTVQTILSGGLEKDIDEPGDLVDAGHLFSTPPRVEMLE